MFGSKPCELGAWSCKSAATHLVFLGVSGDLMGILIARGAHSYGHDLNLCTTLV